MLRSVSYRGNVIEYELRQTDRKSIECRVTPEQVTVFAPRRLPVREADAFVLRQADWIRTALQQAKERARAALERSREKLQEGACIPVEGKNYPILCLPGSQTVVKLDRGQLVVFGAGRDFLQVRAAIREYLITLAKVRLEERVRLYAGKIGVRPNRITLREQKTKWGSCSSLHNLNFNWKLIMAPPDALDYVVVHELCHMIEMNHSPAFWAQVKKYKPDYEIWRDYLKNGFKSPFD